MSLSINETWQERAAILHHDAHMPRGLAEAVAVIFCLNIPPDINPKDWQLMTNLLGRAVDDYCNVNREGNHGN